MIILNEFRILDNIIGVLYCNLKGFKSKLSITNYNYYMIHIMCFHFSYGYVRSTTFIRIF